MALWYTGDMDNKKITSEHKFLPSNFDDSAEWRLDSADLHLASLDKGQQHEDAQVRAIAQRLYEDAIAKLASQLIKNPEVFEAKYTPERYFSHNDFIPTAKLLYEAARKTSTGSNFCFSNSWLSELAPRICTVDGRIFSICDNTVPRGLKLTWLIKVLAEVEQVDPATTNDTFLSFLSLSSVTEDPFCQQLIGLWFSLVAVNNDIDAQVKDKILAHTVSTGEPLTRPCDILRKYFPAALRYWPLLSLMEAPVTDAYAMCAGSRAFGDLPADGVPVLPDTEDAKWIRTHIWHAKNAMADIERLGEVDLGTDSHTTATWVWSMELTAASIRSNPGEFEAHHGESASMDVCGTLSLSNSLYHRANQIEGPPFSYDLAWLTALGTRLALADEDASLLLSMSDDRVPEDVRLSWLCTALTSLESATTVDAARRCHFFDQASIKNEACQNMIALWLALIMDRPDMALEVKITIAYHAVNDRAVGTMTAQNVIRHLIPDALPHWGMIRGLGLKLTDAYVAISDSAKTAYASTLPSLD